MPSAEVTLCCECDEEFTRLRVTHIYCPRCARYFTRPKKARTAPVTWSCQRCRFEFECPDGRHPRYCDECRPIVRQEISRQSYARRGRTLELRRKQELRRKVARSGYIDPRTVTVQMWVERWNERPDLFERLCDDLIKSHKRYPGDARVYLLDMERRKHDTKDVAA